MATPIEVARQQQIDLVVKLFGQALDSELAYRTSDRDESLRALGAVARIAFLVADANDTVMTLEVERRERAQRLQRREYQAWRIVMSLQYRRMVSDDAAKRIKAKAQSMVDQGLDLEMIAYECEAQITNMGAQLGAAKRTSARTEWLSGEIAIRGELLDAARLAIEIRDAQPPAAVKDTRTNVEFPRLGWQVACTWQDGPQFGGQLNGKTRTFDTRAERDEWLLSIS